METAENIAQTLARELPRPLIVHTQAIADEQEAVLHLAVPGAFKHITIDNEKLRDHPRRTAASAA